MTSLTVQYLLNYFSLLLVAPDLHHL